MYYADDVSELIGKTLTQVVNNDDEIIFYTVGGGIYKLFHDQDCCEYVYVEDVIGEFDDLIGTPLLVAEEVSSDPEPDLPEDEQGVDSCTWTFYKFATVRGYVTIRWFGTSNGYYSESVSFKCIKHEVNNATS